MRRRKCLTIKRRVCFVSDLGMYFYPVSTLRQSVNVNQVYSVTIIFWEEIKLEFEIFRIPQFC